MPGFNIAESLKDLDAIVEDAAIGKLKGVSSDEIINFFDAKQDLSLFFE